ncbi:methyltransferase domain-containing protein [Eilatimonas milleporae]|uniref:Methyltransferase family protein n=1 Tax=Eilatimonas milleporae TaxID=911205 RepID=A0A3M0C4M1_9PROT|nr:class I SAM-dependent methyltransferase [Eilatimonas milleporae]RMB04764.1 methyltransferase family protein [Eilatimonas milleporae]
MKEMSKSIPRRLSQPNFLRRYFVGSGLDIGGKPDPLTLYTETFPMMDAVRTWDREDGDAQLLEGVNSESFDFVHSSHCLEHLADPWVGLKNWLRVLKPGGFLILLVPDEDLYEQGVFPSARNADHKWTFTIYKSTSWSPRSINLLDMIVKTDVPLRVEKIELLNATYRFDLPRFDQTMTPIGECAIECVLQKMTPQDTENQGLYTPGGQPDTELRTHYNQYLDDHQSARAANSGRPPFSNTKPL